MALQTLKHICLCFTLCLLSACTMLPDHPPSEAIDFLSARRLEINECGLFVWTADRHQRFILFSQSHTQSGVWADGQGETELTLSQSRGTVAFDQFPEQKLYTPGGVRLDLRLMDREDIVHGARFRHGTLNVTTADGWEKVTPVAGLAVCNRP